MATLMDQAQDQEEIDYDIEVQAIEIAEREHSRVRLAYTTKVYVLYAFSVAFAYGQWVAFRQFNETMFFFYSYEILSIFFFLIGLILTACLAHFYDIRNFVVCNWILYWFNLEMFTVGFSFYLVRGRSILFWICSGVSLGYMIFLALVAYFAPFDFTKYLVKWFFLSLLNFILMVGFVVYIIFYFNKRYYLEVVLGVPAIVIISILHVYIVQLIGGGRKLEMRPYESLLSVMILVDHTLLMFILIYALVVELEWKIKGPHYLYFYYTNVFQMYYTKQQQILVS